MTEAEEFALLEGRAIGPALEAAAAALTGSLIQWSLSGIHHRPGAGVTGIYAIRCEVSGEILNGFLCVTTRPVPGTFARSVRLHGPEGLPLLAWSHPNDPLLPDLDWACDARSVGPELFGVPAATLTTFGYRPMRRAVLRAEGAGETRFLKVLPRGRAAAGVHHEAGGRAERRRQLAAIDAAADDWPAAERWRQPPCFPADREAGDRPPLWNCAGSPEPHLTACTP